MININSSLFPLSLSSDYHTNTKIMKYNLTQFAWFFPIFSTPSLGRKLDEFCFLFFSCLRSDFLSNFSILFIFRLEAKSSQTHNSFISATSLEFKNSIITCSIFFNFHFHVLLVHLEDSSSLCYSMMCAWCVFFSGLRSSTKIEWERKFFVYFLLCKCDGARKEVRKCWKIFELRELSSLKKYFQ